MVYRFFLRTVLSHLVVVGLAYLATFLLWLFARTEDAPAFTSQAITILPATLLGAIYYPIAVKRHRPIPHNPIQQFGVNMLIATYSVVVALGVAWPLATVYQDGTDLVLLALFTGVQVFFAWRLLYHVDPIIAEDAAGRQLSVWGLFLFFLKRAKYHSR
jgi:hypothetical protein